MKKTMMLAIAGTGLIMASCYKTRTCQCTSPDGSVTTATGQVKAATKKKAEKLCSGTCPGGTVSVK